MVGIEVNREFEKIWKDAVMVQSGEYPGICLQRLRKSTKKPVSIAGVPAKIRTEHLANASLERYRSANLLGGAHSIQLKRVMNTE
jgi:hypothetical protein